MPTSDISMTHTEMIGMTGLGMFLLALLLAGDWSSSLPSSTSESVIKRQSTMDAAGFFPEIFRRGGRSIDRHVLDLMNVCA